MDGFAGKILYVDLSAGATRERELDPETARTYLGGRGLGVRLLYDEVPAGADPLGPENKLIFVSGPLAGTGLPGSTHYLAIAKSPLTGLYGEAHAGGAFGVQLKQAGYDALVIEGRAAQPVYLWIHDGQVEIRDASALWGLPTAVTEDRVQEMVANPRATVATIGPAGEKQVKIACIISEKTRVAARTGLGAVMGAKSLKAIAVFGTRGVPVADRAGLREFSRDVVKRMQADAFKMSIRKYGTATVVQAYDAGGILPTQNFQSGSFAQTAALSGESLAPAVVGTKACTGCPIGCVRLVRYATSPLGPVDEAYGGPEYETIASLGSLWMNGDLSAVSKGHELCNAYGIDTISAGVIVAWAIECFERGILTSAELDGLEPRWGDAGTALRLLEKICRQEGVGALLGEGVFRAAQTVGRGSEAYAMHVKGLEIPMHEPRGKKG
ncbi:MAG: aldehyde ferredoxin oxidoreductase family protein, partial [Chloroflexota bacterium]